MIKGKDQKNSGNKEKRILVGRLKEKTEYMRDWAGFWGKFCTSRHYNLTRVKKNNVTLRKYKGIEQ